MPDMLVKLYGMDFECDEKSMCEQYGITVKRAIIIDKEVILDFVRNNFESKTWANECEYALFNNPTSCFIAVKKRDVIGFGCYDATARGYFGPFGVKESERSKGIGKVIFIKCMRAMKEMGYGYAVIGWVGKKAMSFYRREGNAILIEDSSPKNTVYQNMIHID